MRFIKELRELKWNALLLAAAADDYQKALDILERQEALK